LSTAYSTLDELIAQIPDNTGNEIGASDIRDSVYSLWYRMDGFSSSVAGLTVSSEYVSSTPSTIANAIGGILPGSTFSGTIQNVLDTMFYPYVLPSPFITAPSNRQFGQSLSVSVPYSVTKGSQNMSSIIVGGSTVPGSPFTTSQSGTRVISSTHSVSPAGPSQSQTIVITVSDGVNTVTGTTSFFWMNRIYWGSVSIPSHPNLTTNPGSASLVTIACTDTIIKNLNGSGANGLAFGSELSVTKNKTYLGINGSYNTSGEYLVFAWPSTVSGAYTPTFRVNGMVNTAFTRVRNNSIFSNDFGFAGTTYEVWVSNTRYFSPVDVSIN
jgi:hypothetical protein